MCFVINLKKAVTQLVKQYGMTYRDLSDHIGVSKSLIGDIVAGRPLSISATNLLKFSRFLRISIDELLNNQWLPPSQFFPIGKFSQHLVTKKDYPDLLIKKGDYLYIRPFVHSEDKDGDLVILKTADGEELKTYCWQDDQSKGILFHVAGIARPM